MDRWYDEGGNEIWPPRGWGEYFYVVAFFTVVALIVAGALFGLGWVLVYHPWAYGVAAVVMILAGLVIWISWLRSP